MELGHEFAGVWSKEIEAFFNEAQKMYEKCNFRQIPDQVIPLLWMRAKDLKIPYAAPPDLPEEVTAKLAKKRELVGV